MIRCFLILPFLIMPLQILEAQEKPFRHKGKTVKEWLGETKGGTKAARISAVVALGEMGARATDALIIVTSRRDPDVRQLAITFVGVSSGQDKKVVPVLCRCLTDKKQSVREAAAESLFNRGELGRAVLHKNSRSKMLSVRRGSFRGVVVLELADKKSIAMIVRGLKDKDSVIYRLSLSAVKKLGVKAVAAIPALEKLTRHKDPILRAEATKLLRRLRRTPRLY